MAEEPNEVPGADKETERMFMSTCSSGVWS